MLTREQANAAAEAVMGEQLAARHARAMTQRAKVLDILRSARRPPRWIAAIVFLAIIPVGSIVVFGLQLPTLATVIVASAFTVSLVSAVIAMHDRWLLAAAAELLLVHEEERR